VRLAREVPTILALKDAAADVPGTARLLAAVPDRFEVYSGNDDHTLALVALGAVGVVGVATHWCAPQMGELIAAVHKGDLGHARSVNASLLDSYAFESSEEAPNPVPAKAMMRVLGLPVGQCRLPMGNAPEGLETRARAIAAALA
jgi:4-hydroxy-tetrahydrodipicolinate synthase